MCWSIIRDRPTQHARCNVAELRLIEGTRATPGDQTAMGLPIQRILRSRSLWLSCLSQFGTNLGWVFLITWLPRYLLERHQVPVLTRGVMASTPLFVGWLGMLAGGYLTDWLTRRVGQRWGRGLPMSLTRFLAAAAYLGCLLPLGPWSVTLCLALVAFATDLGVASVWAFKQDVGGRFVGSILGWGNMWGNLGAAVSPILLEWMLSRHGDWNAAFLTCAIAFLVSGIAGLGVDATIPIENHVRTTHRSQHVSG